MGMSWVVFKRNEPKRNEAKTCFSIFGGVLRTATKNRKNCVTKTLHFQETALIKVFSAAIRAGAIQFRKNMSHMTGAGAGAGAAATSAAAIAATTARAVAKTGAAAEAAAGPAAAPVPVM